jgi:hypothetical protein
MSGKLRRGEAGRDMSMSAHSEWQITRAGKTIRAVIK